MNPVDMRETSSSPATPAATWTWNPVLSRRSVLKAAAVAALATWAGVGSAAAEEPLAAEIGARLTAGQAALLQRALDELRQAGFHFETSQASVIEQSDGQGPWALLMQDTRIGPHASGADLALTIDPRALGRATIQYVVGESREDGLEILSVVLGERGQRSEERHLLPRAATAPCAATEPGAATAPCAVDLPGGERSEGTPWHYDYCSATSWQRMPGLRASVQLRFTEAAERRNYRIDHEWVGETRTVAIPA